MDWRLGDENRIGMMMWHYNRKTQHRGMYLDPGKSVIKKYFLFLTE